MVSTGTALAFTAVGGAAGGLVAACGALIGDKLRQSREARHYWRDTRLHAVIDVSTAASDVFHAGARVSSRVGDKGRFAKFDQVHIDFQRTADGAQVLVGRHLLEALSDLQAAAFGLALWVARTQTDEDPNMTASADPSAASLEEAGEVLKVERGIFLSLAGEVLGIPDAPLRPKMPADVARVVRKLERGRARRGK